jgi:hypothetical protein
MGHPTRQNKGSGQPPASTLVAICSRIAPGLAAPSLADRPIWLAVHRLDPPRARSRDEYGQYLIYFIHSKVVTLVHCLSSLSSWVSAKRREEAAALSAAVALRGSLLGASDSYSAVSRAAASSFSFFFSASPSVELISTPDATGCLFCLRIASKPSNNCTARY